jgi:hypothetical protein
MRAWAVGPMSRARVRERAIPVIVQVGTSGHALAALGLAVGSIVIQRSNRPTSRAERGGSPIRVRPDWLPPARQISSTLQNCRASHASHREPANQAPLRVG